MMDHSGQSTTAERVASLTSWWDLAGVDTAVGDEAISWLMLDAKIEPVPLPNVPKLQQPEMPDEPIVEWPQDIATLRELIADGAVLPGAGFGNRHIAPTGLENASIMVISDLPDADELAAGNLGSGATGKLLERMLGAIGLRLADCYWTTLASTIPATGELPDAALPDLAAFVRHQIKLIDPAKIIILGSSACRALLGLELMYARGNLQNINHNEGTLKVLTTFHPRTLIARPQMKAQAWKDLQMFAKKDDL